jgi:exodeoxyribonuclease V gamma subunit
LRGSLEVQEILATQGLLPQHSEHQDLSPNTLLHYLQQAVRYSPQVSPQVFSSDVSVQIHRAHNLARQVEILHDALLHAFRADPSLQPHEVVVLCADMASAAPLLQAQFDRDVVVKNNSTRRIPLVVADRGLREVSEGAQLLSGLLALVQSRISRTDLLRLVSLPDIMRNVGVTPDAVDTWDRLLVRTGLSWGLHDAQRHRQGMTAPLADARSWHAALQQTLLGACLPDANPAEELGGVVPLTDIDTSLLSEISALVHVVSRISMFDASNAENKCRAMGIWRNPLKSLILK